RDSLSHVAFVDHRRKLVQRLAGLAYAQMEEADVEAAESTVARHLLNSIRYFDGKVGYSKISAVHVDIAGLEAEGGELKPEDVMTLMDKQFISPTRVERDKELEDEL
ncbi:hypothetical protein INN88_14300, partial [Staphylococcus aureus]|nr:hypothetical protein [Staphylococcus aureus]